MAGTHHIKRFTHTFYKNRGASDVAQVPAEGAAVTVYKQGANVAGGQTVLTSPTTINVRSVGGIVASDTLQVGTDPAKQMIVLSVLSDTSLSLQSTIGSSIVLASDERLVPYSSLPTLYADSRGVGTVGNPRTVPSTGLVEIYVKQPMFDMIVTGTGITPTLYIDREGGTAWGAGAWVNVKDYPTFQAAHDALPLSGGTIFVPAQASFYTSVSSPAFTGLVITKPLVLEGELPFAASGGGCVLAAAAGTENTDMIHVNRGGQVTLKNLYLQGNNTPGSGCGIRWEGSGFMSMLKIEDVVCFRTSSWGIRVVNTGSFVNKLYCTRVACSEAASGGSLNVESLLSVSDNCHFYSCEFNGPGFGTFGTDSLPRGSVYLDGNNTNFRFTNCSWQGNDTHPAFSMRGTTNSIIFSNMYHENLPTAGALTPIFTTEGNHWNFLVDNAIFSQREAALDNGGGLVLKSSTASGAGILSSKFRNIQFLTSENPPAGTELIRLGKANEVLNLDNCWQISTISGAIRPFTVAGAGLGLTTVASVAGAMTLPNTTDNAFQITGTAAVTSIPIHYKGRVVTLVFSSTATLVDGSNLKLVGAAGGAPNSSVTLLSDGTNWIEISRAAPGA